MLSCRFDLTSRNPQTRTLFGTVYIILSTLFFHRVDQTEHRWENKKNRIWMIFLVRADRPSPALWGLMSLESAFFTLPLILNPAHSKKLSKKIFLLWGAASPYWPLLGPTRSNYLFFSRDDPHDFPSKPKNRFLSPPPSEGFQPNRKSGHFKIPRGPPFDPLQARRLINTSLTFPGIQFYNLRKSDPDLDLFLDLDLDWNFAICFSNGFSNFISSIFSIWIQIGFSY